MTIGEQVERIKVVIRNGANVRGALIKGSGKYCVIGGLAHLECGVPDSALREMDVEGAMLVVRKRFPFLHRIDLWRMVDINDAYRYTTKRRAALLELVRGRLIRAQ